MDGSSRSFVKVARVAFERFIGQPAKEDQCANRSREAKEK